MLRTQMITLVIMMTQKEQQIMKINIHTGSKYINDHMMIIMIISGLSYNLCYRTFISNIKFNHYIGSLSYMLRLQTFMSNKHWP